MRNSTLVKSNTASLVTSYFEAPTDRRGSGSSKLAYGGFLRIPRTVPVTRRPLPFTPLSIFFFFFSCLFFLRIAGVAQAIMLWHMLLFGDAFGPAYAIFCVFASNYALFGGGDQTLKNAFNRHATLWSFPAFTAVLCLTHVCTAVCMRVCKVHHRCAYSSTTQKHT